MKPRALLALVTLAAAAAGCARSATAQRAGGPPAVPLPPWSRIVSHG